MIKSIVLLAILLMASVATAEDSPWTAMVLGNEYGLGGGVEHSQDGITAIGLDGRWLEEKSWSVGVVLRWRVTPQISLPVNGLIPQFDILGLPEFVTVGPVLGGRIGYRRDERIEEGNAEVVMSPELILNPDGNVQVAIRYEYQFDDDLWNELSSNPEHQHSTWLVFYKRF